MPMIIGKSQSLSFDRLPLFKDLMKISGQSGYAMESYSPVYKLPFHQKKLENGKKWNLG